jgi:ubiquinone/menaquinone biosynthesis C-methylase UbiE
MHHPITGVPSRFDRMAAEWDSNPTRVALARAVGDAIRAAVPLRPEMQALDFGAGTGLVTLGLLAHVSDITAVDASGEMLCVLAEKLRALHIDNVHTLQCDIACAPLPANSFDLIVSSMVLHHLPDVPGVLQRLRPCLRVGGWIALADLDAEDGSFHADKTGVFHQGFERDTVCRWLEQAGFSDVAARHAHTITRPTPDGIMRQYGVFLITGRVV